VTLSSICEKQKQKQTKKQHPSSPWTPTEHRFPSPHFFVGKLPINATLKFDGTALYICTSDLLKLRKNGENVFSQGPK
jgi:hypothetical protein